jgi:predicted PhzF superfamily epimerase YddE/YHI9
MRGLIVTAVGGDRADFTSRCFFPQSGVPEDSVTGSAHCALAPYWALRLGRKELTGYQASPRGGFVHCTVPEHRVLLKGSAITILRGELAI